MARLIGLLSHTLRKDFRCFSALGLTRVQFCCGAIHCSRASPPDLLPSRRDRSAIATVSEDATPSCPCAGAGRHGTRRHVLPQHEVGPNLA